MRDRHDGRLGPLRVAHREHSRRGMEPPPGRVTHATRGAGSTVRGVHLTPGTVGVVLSTRTCTFRRIQPASSHGAVTGPPASPLEPSWWCSPLVPVRLVVQVRPPCAHAFVLSPLPPTPLRP